MRRRTVHLVFGVAVAACAVVAGYYAVRLHEAQRVNEAIAQAKDVTSSDALAASKLPEARFARAVALAKSGDYEGSLKQYKVLSRGDHPTLATDALYNAGNLQLREAMKAGRDAAVRMLPLIELAKQSYRSTLRRDPTRWEARYNLERALWLAPELDEVLSESVKRDAEDRVMSTLQSTRADLP